MSITRLGYTNLRKPHTGEVRYTLGYTIPSTTTQNPYNIQSVAETPTATHPYVGKTWA